MKIAGSTWKRFYLKDDAYWRDYYHNSSVLVVNGEKVENYEDMDDAAEVEVISGEIFHWTGQELMSLQHFLILWLEKERNNGRVYSS